MKNFKFRFETVEKVRKKNEDLALQKFANEQRKFQELISKRMKQIDNLNNALNRRDRFSEENRFIGEYQLENILIQGAHIGIYRLDQTILKAQKKLKKIFDEYLHARKETKKIELLRENDFQEFKQQKSKLEAKSSHDLTTMRFRFTERSRS